MRLALFLAQFFFPKGMSLSRLGFGMVFPRTALSL
jgi:hypothetical protein